MFTEIDEGEFLFYMQIEISVNEHGIRFVDVLDAKRVRFPKRD